MMRLDADSIRRIAVLRANGLGDFLFATPALRALSAGFPRAEITFLGLPWMMQFVEGRYPYIHRTRIVPPYPGIRRVDGDPKVADAEAARFFRWCQDERFDLAIQMHGGGVESNPFVRRLGARHSLGLTGPGVTRLDHNLTYQYYQSEVMRYLELVEQLGVPSAGTDLDAPEVPGDEERLRLVWPGLSAGEYVVVHPGASDPRRHWPIERFAALADDVQQAYGRRVVVTGSLSERSLARELQRRASRPVV
ncbi:MAG: glycosyltransferase family 9 protein, partial [Chloroflexota bacterium]